MPIKTESRRYTGPSGLQGFGGERSYLLRFTYLADGRIAIELDPLHSKQAPWVLREKSLSATLALSSNENAPAG